MKFIFDRIKEPSTWSALSALGLLIGLPPGTVDLAHQIVIGVVGLAGIVMAERAKP